MENVTSELAVSITDWNISSIIRSATVGYGNFEGIWNWCDEIEAEDENGNKMDYAEWVEHGCDCVLNKGGTLLLHDSNKNETHTLTSDILFDGLCSYIEENRSVFAYIPHKEYLMIDTGEIDTNRADTIVQYALFGKKKYK